MRARLEFIIPMQTNDRELRELRGLVERIKRGDCVLVLGPRVAVRAGDPERVPLDELLAQELLDALGPDAPQGAQPMTLRRAADLYYRVRKDRDDLELTVQDFYAREAETTDFHRDLAHLPFRLCVSASPDNLMLKAFAEAGKTPQQGHYNFREPAAPRLAMPTSERPLVYHLFGHYEDPQSLVLTEADLIEFIVSIVKGSPPVPDQVRHVLADAEASFLFLGFGFQHWYLRVLLQVMNIYGHRSKAIAFEDEQFFAHPDRDQTVGFFSGDRLIDFRKLRWEEFARQLREASEAGVKKNVAAAAAPPPPADAPKAFLSYASEDRETVEALAEELQSRGIRVWQDKQDLRAGDNWNDVLMGVIGSVVDYVVVVQTPAMVGRVEGVFHREIEAALLRQSGMGEADGQKFRFLIPVKIGEIPLLSSLSRSHVIDVGNPTGIQMLAQSIDEDWQRRMARKTRVVA